MRTKDEVIEEIKAELKGNPIVLYMKGTAQFPQCGFSHRAVEILRSYGVRFKDINILADSDKRQILKEYSEWATYPQIYVGGELLGGCDILTELHSRNELEDQLKVVSNG